MEFPGRIGNKYIILISGEYTLQHIKSFWLVGSLQDGFIMSYANSVGALLLSQLIEKWSILMLSAEEIEFWQDIRGIMGSQTASNKHYKGKDGLWKYWLLSFISNSNWLKKIPKQIRNNTRMLASKSKQKGRLCYMML